MNITVFSRRLGPGGGTAGVAFALGRELVNRGHSVRVVCESHVAVPDGVRIVPWRAAGGLIRRRGDRWLGLDRVAAADVVRASGGVHRAWSRNASVSVWRHAQTLRWDSLREGVRERRAYRSARLVV